MKMLIHKAFEKTNLALFCLFAFSILWNRVASNIVLFVWLGFSCFIYIKNKNLIRLPFIFYLLSSFIGLYLISWVYTPDLSSARTTLIRSLYLFIIPFCVYIFSVTNKTTDFQPIWKSLISSNILTSLFFIIYAIHQTFIYGSVNPFHEINGNFFSYIEFTQALKIHPIYYGLFTCMSLAYLTRNLLIQQKVSIWQYPIIAFLIIIILLLNSFTLTAGLGILMLMIFYYIFNIQYKFDNKRWIFLIILFIMSIGLGSHFILEKSKGIHVKHDITNTDFSGNDFTALRARVAKSTASFNIFQRNPIFGVGTGKAQEILMQEYEAIGFEHGVDRHYNSHNQYLTFMIQFGSVGLFIFSTLLAAIINQYVKNQSILLLYFFLLSIIIFLSESILERQNGMIFFTLFLSLLYFQPNKSIQH